LEATWLVFVASSLKELQKNMVNKKPKRIHGVGCCGAGRCKESAGSPFSQHNWLAQRI
jgi:hypothetical protein